MLWYVVIGKEKATGKKCFNTYFQINKNFN